MSSKDNGKRSVIKIELGLYSVQWYDDDPGPCCKCGREVGAGPGGFSTDETAGPLCDGCLLLLNKDLGNMVWLAHMARELAERASKLEDPWTVDQVLVTMMTFAKMYDQSAEWPRREAKADILMKELQARMAKKPWEELLQSVIAPAS